MKKVTFQKKLVLMTCINILFYTLTFAQLSEKGKLYSIGKTQLNKDVPMVTMRSVDMRIINQQDKINDRTAQAPYRFGIEHRVNIDMQNEGMWEDLPNGDRLWRLEIYAPKAKSINLVYSDFYLPKGRKLFLHNENQEQVLGAFTSANNKKDNSFSTALIYGEKTYVEYYEPAKVKGKGRIHINTGL